MATITTKFNEGGANAVPSGGASPSLATALRDINTDLAALRASLVGIVAKLDADAGVSGTDYASLWAPAALTSVNG